jgi:Uncharacterized protein conserved in bacteria (DUF2255)
MVTWRKNELRKIAETDDLHISPLREDGATYGTPTWIWSVVVGDDLYVRAYNGKNSRWYQAAKVPQQRVSQPDDRCASPFRDRQGRAAREEFLTVAPSNQGTLKRERTPGCGA